MADPILAKGFFMATLQHILSRFRVFCRSLAHFRAVPLVCMLLLALLLALVLELG